MDEDQRYVKEAGVWRIEFRRRDLAASPVVEEAASPCPLVAGLVERGVTAVTAGELVAAFPVDRVTAKVAVFDWLVARHDRKVSTNPAGYLAKSIRDDFAAPQGFRSRATIEAERERVAEDERHCEARRDEARAADHRQRAIDAVVDAHLAGLSDLERAELERDALAATNLDSRLFRRLIVREHVATLLAGASPAYMPQPHRAKPKASASTRTRG